MKPVPGQLFGERVHLRMMELEDVPHKVRWLNDPEVSRTMIIDPVSEIGTRAWLQKVALDPSRMDLIIVETSTELPIGFATLVHIDHRNRKAETYLAIGERSHWKRGFGLEAKLILLHFAFESLGLNRIYSFNLADNDAVIALNKKLGFRVEGTLRSDVRIRGEYRDRKIMSITHDEFMDINKTVGL